MKPHLLDVNVLLALLWPRHMHHAAAHGWFAAEADRQWATCPLTQASFVRLSCNPAIAGRTVLMPDALSLLRQNTARPDHLFVPADLSLADAMAPFGARLGGHQQLADAYLLSLAAHHGAVLTTLDRRIASLAPEPLRQHLEVIAV